VSVSAKRVRDTFLALADALVADFDIGSVDQAHDWPRAHAARSGRGLGRPAAAVVRGSADLTEITADWPASVG
jgi:hypothetical protein